MHQVFSLVQRIALASNAYNQYSLVKMQQPVLYHKLEEVLDVLQNERSKTSQGVKLLLEEYEKLKESYDKEDKSKKYPLVVFEGLDGCGKSTTSKKFAKIINARLYRTPPICLDKIRPLFEDDKVLRTAFYSLGNYIGAMELHKLLKESPIVVDRFWHSTAAFAIAQNAEDFPETYQMPLKGDPIYMWPEDLIKPDLIFYLDVTESTRLTRLSRRVDFTKQERLIQESSRFRNNIVEAYRNIENPSVTFVNSNSTFRHVLNDLKKRFEDFNVAC